MESSQKALSPVPAAQPSPVGGPRRGTAKVCRRILAGAMGSDATCSEQMAGRFEIEVELRSDFYRFLSISIDFSSISHRSLHFCLFSGGGVEFHRAPHLLGASGVSGEALEPPAPYGLREPNRTGETFSTFLFESLQVHFDVTRFSYLFISFTYLLHMVFYVFRCFF